MRLKIAKILPLAFADTLRQMRSAERNDPEHLSTLYLRFGSILKRIREKRGLTILRGGLYIPVCPIAPLSSATLFSASPADNLSTVPEFGGILIGQLDKYLSRDEVQAAIRELGSFLGQQSDR